MSAVDATDLEAILKEFYTKENVRDMGYEDNPMFAALPKKTDAGGEYYVQPVQYGRGNGRSRVYATAQANKSGNKYQDFIVPYRDDFGTTSITRKALKQAKGGASSFFEAKSREFDAVITNLTRNAAISAYRNSGGARGRINSSGVTALVFTLEDPEEITNFEEGMTLQFSANDGSVSSHALIDAGGTAIISAINTATGAITLASITNVPSIAANNYIFQEDDFQLSFNGFLDWCPLTAPTSTLFLNVNRATHSRLGGNRLTLTTGSMGEACKKLLNLIRREGGHTSHLFTNVANYQQLEFEEGDRVRYDVMKPQDATVGFEGIKIVGTGGQKPVMVLPDINCPDDILVAMNMDDWALVSLGEVPEVVDEDGVTMLREATASAFEFRAEYYANLSCADTRNNGVGILSTT